ncbi:flagellar protein FliT [Cupriavidus gilardii]|uniref:Flagellar protein FliT n=1 Tax=Cupriavidus gilardii TaxID=82541 RepID=A0ABY4VM13_9BURK|nr:flagellar protein FliT [Cupriavidus gilardii]QQE09262.1 flagellar protein FliT [Cupriavidus sp. ISTL7]MCT9070141.1 flagellar protein FliT [Cupriavidus gilardii]MCT9117363.1 flagellar protein FliT [Cupriavidus gilardii]MCT9126625.1 flagellar protein FliT [Cupriavidus gilardii]QKS61888.1 flagellar protein FliT [Cupriavidus gilardii]
MMRTVSPTVLNYEELLVLSEQMLEAAEAENWTAFNDVQTVYLAVVDRLRELEHNVPVSAEERMRRHALLDRILAYDARIRDLMLPHLARLGQLLGDSRRRQNLSHAYGSLA